MSDFYTFDGRLPIILHTIGEIPHQQPIHRNADIKWNQLIWVRNGEGEFYSGERNFTLTKGMGVLLRHRESHGYEGKNFHTAFITFSASENLLNYIMGDRKYLVFDVPEFLDKETEDIQALARSGAATFELSAAVYSLLSELHATFSSDEDSVITGAKKFMKENYSRSISLDDIAAAVGSDRFALCKYFKKHHKRSVMSELRKIRISAAKRMLRYSCDSIETIAKTCGFEDPSYFALRFREECSCSPHEYRNKYL